MTSLTWIVFAFVYLGMVLGRVPGLALDRSGIALLGAIVLITSGVLSPAQAWAAVDVPTIALLFGLMVISAQLRLGRFYGRVAWLAAGADLSPPLLLGAWIAAGGLLSAVLANDIVCLAMTPVVIDVCRRRGLEPMPFLLALACASNVGSAATLIGNPQNMLIGQTLALGFTSYLAVAAVPSLLGLGVIWAVVVLLTRGRWWTEAPPLDGEPDLPFHAWQTTKGLLVVSLVMAGFLFTRLPREVIALAGAGLLLTSRSMRSEEALALVDWQLIVLFAGLFVANHAMAVTGNTARLLEGVTAAGLDPTAPLSLYLVTPVLSNLVSNVPAVMLLLPAAVHPAAGPVLALSSTLAGNLFLVGSIANLIVVAQAASRGIAIGWRDHLRIGLPVGLATLALTGLWLLLIGG